jgi:acyl carrier protein
MVQELIALAATHFGVDAAQIEPTDDVFERLGIDSMKALELLTEIEMTFDVEIPDYELQDMKTFQDLADIIAQRR